MSKQMLFTKAPIFGLSEDEISTGAVNDNEVGVINGKKIKSHSITSDQIAAGAIGAVQLQAGAITAFKITVPNRVKGTTVVFSVGGTNNDTLQWTDGVAYLMKMKYTPGDTMGDLQVVQVQQTISGGSYQFKAGDSAYYFYVEWAKDKDSDEPADSATLTMQKSDTYPDSDTAIVLAYAWYDNVLGLAQFQALDTAGGGVRISGNSILAGSITAQNIKAGTITADKLSFQAFDKNKDTLDSVADGSQYAKVSRTDISAGHILLDSVIQNGEYGLIRRTFIEDGKLSLTEGVIGKLNNKNLDKDDPTDSGLYMTYNHLGFWNGSAWTVDIQKDGTAIFGIDGSSNYLKWDGTTLTVKGNIVSSTITSSTITGSSLETNASGERIEISTSNYIYFYEANNLYTAMIYAPTGVGLTLQSYRGLGIFASWDITIQSSQGNIDLIPANGSYVVVEGSLYMSANKPIYFGGTNSSIYGDGGNLTITSGVSVNGLLYVGYGIQSNGTISLGSGYGIQFYSPSGQGGKFWYSGGNLYFTDEGGNTRTISYT